MGRNYGLPTACMATYMGLTDLRVRVGQAEETNWWWKRYKRAFVLFSYVLLLLLYYTPTTTGREAIPDNISPTAGCFIDLSDVLHLSWIYDPHTTD